MPATAEGPYAARTDDDTSGRELLVAMLAGRCAAALVATALDHVERDPLCTVGYFRGDLLRGLMEVQGAVWTRHPWLYARFLGALRAGAAMRRRLPPEQRMSFWTPLDVVTDARRSGAPDGPVGDG
jgi:hypothetical protein